MSEQQPGETTRLLEPKPPQYVFGSSIARKRRIRQFQCCVCSIFIIGLLTALVITVAYTMNLPLDPNANSTSMDDNDTLSTDVFIIMFYNKTWPLNDEEAVKTFSNNTNLTNAMREGQILLEERDAIEKNTPSLNIDSPSYRHQKAMGTNEKARNITRKGYQLEGATQYIYRKNKTNESSICFTNQTDLFLIEMCTNIAKECNLFYKYRSYNGTCNNLKHPNTYGVAYRPFRRALRPDYADGISKPRVSRSGRDLPTARTVSLEVHRPYFRDDAKFSVMLAVWGQFLDHDITATALSQKQDGSSISCCQVDGILSPECFPVFIDSTDPFAEYNITCMEFVRSASAPNCCLGPREQLNQATAFIDGSVVYGNDKSRVDSLRTMSKGLLKMHLTEDNRTLLPVSDDINDGCNREEERKKGRYCFATGDSRANENLHLTSMHLIWARHHNKMAKNLSNLNPHWDDERIFQEARRIVAAQIQHITYSEFLPILLGDELMKQNNLLPRSKGYFKKYNDSIDPSIANEFAAAGFRFAHSIIPGLVKLIANDSSSTEFIQMRKMLFDPFKLYQKGQLDRTLKGAMNTSIEASDSYFSEELKSHLFQRTAESSTDAVPQMCGLDLVSLNIQRGRDHGLAGYIFWKKHCGLNKTNNFDDLHDTMDAFSLKNIEAIYRDVADIDLYTGALSEKPIKGSILGPTLTCLILDQFIRLKYGDRFWYENPQSFTPDQLNEIRKSTLARIICDNADHLESVQPFVMARTHKENKNMPCSEIPSVKLSLWKEKLQHVSVPTQQLNINIVS